MPISIPVAMLITQGITTGAQVYANRSANKAQEKAFQSQQQAERYQLDQQLQLERERAAEERRRYDLEAREREEAAEARKPFDNFRMAAMAAFAKMNGIDLPPELLASMMGQGRGQTKAPFATAADIRTGQPPVGDARVSGGPSLLDAARGAVEQPQIYRPVMTPDITATPTQMPLRAGQTGTMAPMGGQGARSFLDAVKQAEELAKNYRGYFAGGQ